MSEIKLKPCPFCGSPGEWNRRTQMNNDLISRKALLDRLRGNVLVDVTPEIEKTIEEQPTAFDKVR